MRLVRLWLRSGSEYSVAKFKRPEIPLVRALKHRQRRERRAVFLLLALGAVHAIRQDREFIRTAERIVFNLDVLRHVKRIMKDRHLAGVIGYGMQLSDIVEYVHDPKALTEACDTIELMIHNACMPRLK